MPEFRVKSLKRLESLMRLFQTSHQMYAHINWNTVSRVELIDGEVKRALGKIIREAANEEGYEILAYEAVSEHVHLVVRFKPSHCIADFVKKIKGKSSRIIPYSINKPIKWQKGYGITTVGPKALNSAIQYVKDQKNHHSNR